MQQWQKHCTRVPRKYTAQEYQEMVRYYYLAGGNIAEATRMYAEHAKMKGRRVPATRTIFNAVCKFRENGTFTPNLVSGGYDIPQINSPSIQRVSLSETKTVYARSILNTRKRSGESEKESKAKKRKKKADTDKCCCCLTEAGDRNIWSTGKKSGDDNVYGRLLQQCFDITIGNQNIKEGHTICNNCKEQLIQAFQFKQQVLECQHRIRKSMCEIKDTLACESESELPDLYDLPEDTIKVDIKGMMIDMSDDDDKPLATLDKTKVKDITSPKIKKLKKKKKDKKSKKKKKCQALETVPIEFEKERKKVPVMEVKKPPVVDPNIIVLEEDNHEDDVIFVNNIVPETTIIELEQDNNQDEIVPVPAVALNTQFLEQDKSQDEIPEPEPEPEQEPEPEPEVAGISAELEEDSYNQDENVEPGLDLEPKPDLEQVPEPELEPKPEIEPVPEDAGIVTKSEQEIENTNQDKNVDEMEPETESELQPEPVVEFFKEENIADDEEDPIKIGNTNHVNEEVSVKYEPNGDENVAIQEEEVIAELLPAEGPDPLNGINVNPEVKEEIECVSSTIDDSAINVNTLQDRIEPDTYTGQASAVKHLDAIYNCTLREMLIRPSNILQDLNRRGKDMLQIFNERLPVPQVKPQSFNKRLPMPQVKPQSFNKILPMPQVKPPGFNETLPVPQAIPSSQLNRVHIPKRSAAVIEIEVPKPTTSKEQSKVKKVVANYLDLLR